MIRRIEALERYSSNHGESLTALTNQTLKHDERIGRLEEFARLREIAEAREDERDKALYQRLDGIDNEIEDLKSDTNKRLDKITGIGSKALWVFFSGILLATWQFIQQGGLAQ